MAFFIFNYIDREIYTKVNPHRSASISLLSQRRSLWFTNCATCASQQP